MLKPVGLIVSILLIGIIFLRVPKESLGLSSSSAKNNLFDSPSTAERFLNLVISVGVLIYVGIALQLNYNLSNN